MERQQMHAVRHPLEEMFAHPVGVDAGQVVRRDDLVGVDVRSRDRKNAALDDHAGTAARSS